MKHTTRHGLAALVTLTALAACGGTSDPTPGVEPQGGTGAAGAGAPPATSGGTANATGGSSAVGGSASPVAGSPAAGTGGSGEAGGSTAGAPTGGSESGGAAGSSGSGGAATSGASGSAGASGSGGMGQPENYLVHAHFTNAAVGKYERADVQADFGVAPPWDNGLSAGRANIVQEGDSKFLRVTYPNAVFGPANGGVQFVVALGDSYDELFFAYRVRFQSGFGFNMGGKLPGLVGGSSPTGCKPDEGGFSARNMWRGSGAIVQYVYWPDQANTCGDDRYYRTNGNNVPFKPGTWMTVEHRIKMNTVGQNNGVLEGWVDGVRYLNETNRQWRKTNGFAIDALYFSTFFGGGSQPWASPKEQHADFDDLIVSEEPISH